MTITTALQRDRALLGTAEKHIADGKHLVARQDALIEHLCANERKGCRS